MGFASSAFAGAWPPKRAHAVSFGGFAPESGSMYRNRRAELYGELRNALEPKRRAREMLKLPAER